jgi:hypothetical protein
MPQSPTNISLVITIENTDEIIPSVKFSREKNILARFSVCTTSMFGFFIPDSISNEWEITDRSILSVKMLPTVCVSHTDRMNPSVKLFNGVVCIVYLFDIN